MRPRDTDRRDRVRLALLSLACSLPAVIAVAAAWLHGWWPAGDDAVLAMRIGDVFSGHPPLQGMRSTAGLASAELAGHHLGPVQLYLMAPFVALGGGGPRAVLVTVLLLHLVSAYGCLWVARRLGGYRLVVLVAVAIGVMQATVGAQTLFRPLNPFVALMPILLMALTCWAVLLRDRSCLPLFALSASFVAQANLAFVPAVLAAVLMVSGALLRMRRAERTGRAPARSPATRRAHDRHVVAPTLLILVLCWAPVLWEQLSYHPGNLSQTVRYALGGGAPGTRAEALPMRVWHALTWVLQNLPPWPGGNAPPGLSPAAVPRLLLGLLELVLLLRWARRHPVRSVRVGAGTVLVLVVAMWLTLALSGVAGNAPEYWLLPITTLTPLGVIVLLWGALVLLPTGLRPRPRVRVGAAALGVVLAAGLGVSSAATTDWGDVDQARSTTAPLADYLRTHVRADAPVQVSPQGAYPYFNDATALGYRLEHLGMRAYSVSGWPHREDMEWRQQDSAPFGAVQVTMVQPVKGKAPTQRPRGTAVALPHEPGQPAVRAYVDVPRTWRR